MGRSEGVQYLDFDRETSCLEEAVLSAVADIESVEGLEVVRIADAGSGCSLMQDLPGH